MIQHLFLFLFLFISIVGVDKNLIYGKWKLEGDEVFLNIMTLEAFKMGTEEQQNEMAKVFQFVLDSTFYDFKKDSVFFTDAGPGGIVKHKNGRWLLKEDTIVILESGKIKSHKFIIDHISENEMNLRKVLDESLVARSLLKYRKVDP
ncbi:hypothetical protein Aoki45_13060 [Algoriphagus sp. oki45]|uniref:hypothetical protein n=1 Tax=Algoriphagus sp. oki45 TaxID=3067294 RepID=UPI0027EFD7DE|nr:hypothetical protein Aoki45_13060 [Algoriphagus sp. oki45]